MKLEHNRKWNDSNWFVDSSVTSLSSCCRLRNDFSELGYYNSIGGAALKVGSVKVSTINLARIAYETETEQQYLNRLREVLEINLKLLDVQRHVIERNIEKGLLHTFDCKMIEMQYLYSSIMLTGPFCKLFINELSFWCSKKRNRTYWECHHILITYLTHLF